jgi:hypothetical protein
MPDGELDPTLVLFSDKPWFHLSGYVNSQSVSYFSAESSILIHRVALCDVKVGKVWYEWIPFF